MKKGGEFSVVATSTTREGKRSDVDWRGYSQPGPGSWLPMINRRKGQVYKHRNRWTDGQEPCESIRKFFSIELVFSLKQEGRSAKNDTKGRGIGGWSRER